MTDRILLVEDDPGSRDLIGALLAARGDAFDCAADGFLGLRLLSERRHAVVEHRPHEALDQHRCLAGARPGTYQQRALAHVDSALLLGCELHASTRQMDGWEHPPR